MNDTIQIICVMLIGGISYFVISLDHGAWPWVVIGILLGVGIALMHNKIEDLRVQLAKEKAKTSRAPFGSLWPNKVEE